MNDHAVSLEELVPWDVTDGAYYNAADYASGHPGVCYVAVGSNFAYVASLRGGGSSASVGLGPLDSVFTGVVFPDTGGGFSGYMVAEDYGFLGARPVIIGWWFLSGFFFAFVADIVYGWLGLAIGGIFRTVPDVFT